MNDSERVDNPQQDYSDDISADIAKALDGIDPASEAAVEPTESTRERARDDQGRFASEADKTVPKDAAKPAEHVKGQGPAQSDPELAAQVKSPPTSWPKEFHDKWNSLSPEVQQLIERREADQHKYVTTAGQDLKFAKSIREVLQPYEQNYRAAGLDQVSAIRTLMEIDSALRGGSPQQKVQIARDLIEQFDIDLGQLVDAQATPPDVLQLRAEIEAMRQYIERSERQKEESIGEKFHQEISAFSSDPANKHFDAVRADMAKLVAAGVVDNLKDAYDHACWSNPTIRASLMAEQQLQAKAEREAEESKRVAAARNRSVGVTGAPGLTRAPSNSNDSSSIEDDIRAAFDAVGGRL